MYVRVRFCKLDLKGSDLYLECFVFEASFLVKLDPKKKVASLITSTRESSLTNIFLFRKLFLCFSCLEVCKSIFSAPNTHYKFGLWFKTMKIRSQSCLS